MNSSILLGLWALLPSLRTGMCMLGEEGSCMQSSKESVLALGALFCLAQRARSS